MPHRPQVLNTLALAIGGALLLMLAATPAQATLYRNPVTDTKAGKMDAGAGISRDLLTIFFDYGLGEAGTLEGFLGNIDTGLGSATEFGAGYRHEFNRKTSVADKSVRLAAFGTLAIGSGNADFTQIDAGFGGSSAINDEFNAYAAAVLRHRAVTGFSENRLGVFGGVEYTALKNVKIGGELHLGFEKDTFGLFASLGF